MGGCRCSYKNCTNTTKSAEINFFQYPVKHRSRCVNWIENSEKPAFYDLEEDQLRNKVICESHFEEKWFLNSQRKRLLHGAIPTLDGNSNHVRDTASPNSRDAPVYLPSNSNQYSDVKVVPTNNDGTVFVLDTENMFTISPKIESYIIKNGVLVPTNSNSAVKNTTGRFIRQSTSNRFTKPSTSTAGYVMGAETEIANINTPPGPSKTLLKENSHQSNFLKSEVGEAETENGDFFSHEEPSEKKIVSEDVKHKAKQGHTISNNHGHSKSAVTKNYLRQIKKHSRDIATIKRMLKQKRIAQQAKPSIKNILAELQQHVPSSLFTIISLILGEKNDLNGEDIEFFTTLHRASPEVYQMLSDKYKWNLPSIELVVDTTEPF
ncbi:uncharacterized protein LOC109532906 [Dendroctonus ponderosae]